eukprot:jgi/Ulvmu1/6942/UM032_0020.1
MTGLHAYLNLAHITNTRMSQTTPAVIPRLEAQAHSSMTTQRRSTARLTAWRLAVLGLSGMYLAGVPAATARPLEPSHPEATATVLSTAGHSTLDVVHLPGIVGMEVRPEDVAAASEELVHDGRQLRHGRCLTEPSECSFCPRCTRIGTSVVGHCRQGGRLFTCGFTNWSADAEADDKEDGAAGTNPDAEAEAEEDGAAGTNPDAAKSSVSVTAPLQSETGSTSTKS